MSTADTAKNVLSDILSVISAAPAIIADGEALVSKGLDIIHNTSEGKTLADIFNRLFHHTAAPAGAATVLTPKT